MGGLFNRLAVQTALLVTVVLGLIGVFLAVQVGGAVGAAEETRYRERVQRGRDQLQDQIVSFAGLTETGAVVLTASPDVRDAMAKRDVVGALRAVTAFSEVAGSPFQSQPGMQLYDQQGSLLVRAHNPLNNRQQVTPPEVARVLSEGQPLGGVRHDELLGLVLTGVAPVNGPDGRRVGAIEVMSTIDANFAVERGRALGMNVAVLDTTGVVTASEGDMPLSVQDLPAALAEQEDRGAASIMIGDTRFLATFMPLVSPSGQLVGHLYTGIDDAVDPGERQRDAPGHPQESVASTLVGDRYYLGRIAVGDPSDSGAGRCGSPAPGQRPGKRRPDRWAR